MSFNSTDVIRDYIRMLLGCSAAKSVSRILGSNSSVTAAFLNGCLNTDVQRFPPNLVQVTKYKALADGHVFGEPAQLDSFGNVIFPGKTIIAFSIETQQDEINLTPINNQASSVYRFKKPKITPISMVTYLNTGVVEVNPALQPLNDAIKAGDYVFMVKFTNPSASSLDTSVRSYTDTIYLLKVADESISGQYLVYLDTGIREASTIVEYVGDSVADVGCKLSYTCHGNRNPIDQQLDPTNTVPSYKIVIQFDDMNMSAGFPSIDEVRENDSAQYTFELQPWSKTFVISN